MKILLYFLLFSNICFGQTAQKTITVQGIAKARVRPDVATITFQFEKTDTSQAKAMAKANNLADALTQLLLHAGLSSKQIKISEYSVNGSYNLDRKRKEYTVSNTLVARLGFEEKNLNQFLKSVETERINDLNISFDYSLSDSLERVTRTKLTQEAIARAKEAAENISQTLKVPVKSIIQVSKNGLQPIPPQLETAKFTPPVIKRDQDIKYESVFGTYEVEEKELEEEITLVYEIGT